MYHLYIMHIHIGISIGGCGPIVFSILGDCFPGSSRVYVSTIMGLSMSAGVCVCVACVWVWGVGMY